MNQLPDGGSTGRCEGTAVPAGTAVESLPFVSIVMPVFNEERFIAHTLATVFEQDYPPDRFEVIIADGMSSDRTRELLDSFQKSHPNLRVIDNPGRIVSSGLNRAIECARGEIIVRLDGHNVYARNFVSSVVKLSEDTGADNAGGVLVPTGKGYVGKSIAAAYYSPLGIGGAQRGHFKTNEIRQVDTVHGGCWRRERLISVGMFDEEMVRNQDDELSFRIRKRGGRIVQSAAIRIQYYVRDRFGRLFMQFAQYGYWKVRVVRKHPAQASVRHLVPSIFVVAVLLGILLAPFNRWIMWAAGALLALYLVSVASAALRQALRSGLLLWPGIALALVLMNIGYGLGFIVGCVRGLMGPLPTDQIFERGTR